MIGRRGRERAVAPTGPAIEVVGLGVRYNLRLTRKNTIRNSLSQAIRRDGVGGHFWALRDVSFTV
ncbi:MAG: hypothetical protein ABIZ71_00630, partial [Gemmatimonadales bacterium]